MTPSLDAVRQRLDAVDATLVNPSRITEMRAEGARMVRTAPAALLRTALDLARRNPVLAGALSAGAVTAADARMAPTAQAALGASLVWWGALGEARLWLDEAAAQPSPDALTGACMRWYRAVAARRLGETGYAAPSLFNIADTLDELGEHLLAQRCRLDAASGLPVNSEKEVEALTASLYAFFEAHGHHVDICIMELTRAFTFFAHDRFSESAEALERAELLAGEEGFPALEVYAWLQRASQSRTRRDMQAGQHWAVQALERAEGLRHDYYIAIALAEQAANLDDTSARVAVYERLRHLNPVNVLPGTLADRQLVHADHHYAQGEYAQAEDAYSGAHAIFVEANNPWIAAVALARLGRVKQQLGRYTEALADLTGALDDLEDDGATDDLQRTHRHLGQLYTTLGYYEPAIEHLRHALALAQDTRVATRRIHPAVGVARLLTADTHLKDWDEAERLLSTARADAAAADLHADVAQCDLALGDLHLARRDAAGALAAYTRSKTQYEVLNDAQHATRAALGMADAELVLGRIAAAETRVAALPAGDRLAVEDRWQAQTVSARAAAARGDAARALRAYTDALLAVRQARRTLDEETVAERFVVKLWAIYREAFALALAERDTASALMLAELHGAQLLSARRGYPPPDEADLRSMPAALRDRLTARLGDAWTVLRTVWDGRAFHAFVLTPTGLDVYPLLLGPLTQAALAVVGRYDDSFRRHVFLNSDGASARRLDTLADALLPAPVRERLTPDHTLIVVPAERLHAVPFQALMDGGEPLIARTRITYARSLEVLAHALAAAPAERPLDGRGLVLYQSEFSQPGYPPLPFVPQEVSMVTRIPGVPASRVPLAALHPEQFHRLAAGRGLAAYDWLHFATHTAVDPQTGAFTGLLAADGVLDAYDIRGWQLDARLVTLSACQTGLGKWHYGDEFDGLVQAFLAAGAQTLVASLWLASDEATAELMVSFYQRLAGGESVSAALAGAQRAAIADGLSAYHWAPFSVFGVP